PWVNPNGLDLARGAGRAKGQGLAPGFRLPDGDGPLVVGEGQLPGSRPEGHVPPFHRWIGPARGASECAEWTPRCDLPHGDGPPIAGRGQPPAVGAERQVGDVLVVAAQDRAGPDIGRVPEPHRPLRGGGPAALDGGEVALGGGGDPSSIRAEGQANVP